MIYNTHFNIRGKHAFLSGSNWHWINYTEEKLRAVFVNAKAKEEGTELHDLASVCVKKKIKLAPLKKALNQFVNDAIGFGMESEQVLYFSDNCFGTADAISFKDGILRIHDLKTGLSKVSFNQLHIYAAIFCLEYAVDPETITIVERIYQHNGFDELLAIPEEIRHIMNIIMEFDEALENLKLEIV